MATTMKLIAKQTLTSTTASVTFSDIPGTPYADLVVVMSARSNRASQPEDSFKIQVNSDTGNNYTSRVLYGMNGGVYSQTEASVGYGTMYGIFPAATATASTFGNAAIYISNYAGSTNKSMSLDGAAETNAANGPGVGGAAILWSSTAAITSIKLFPYYGSFVSDSSFFLYGITKS